MNILFVSAVFPYPLHSGGQTRMYNLLKRLSKKHRITLAAFVRDRSEAAYAQKLPFLHAVHTVYRGRAWQAPYVTKTLAGKYPLLLTTYDLPEMRTLISELLKKSRFDLVHLEPFYVWPVLPDTTLPVVVSEHNVEYSVYARYVRGMPFIFKPFLAWDVGKLTYWEKLVWRSARTLTAVSQKDARTMEEYLGHEVPVVENGVDVSVFTYKKPVSPSGKRALFVGNFRWLPNREAADMLVSRIWPEITKKHPDAVLTIAGKHARLLKIPKKTHLRVLNDPGDIVSVYHDADVFVAPMGISGGSKYKMLEAMATGIPIVATDAGMHGLTAEAGIQYSLADTPESFRDTVSALWEKPAEAVRFSKAARALVERDYSWENIARKLDRIWQKST